MTADETFLKKLRAAFVEEAHEQMLNISTCFNALLSVQDESEKKKLVETGYREVHNLKGSARAVNLSHLESVCQSLEDVLALIKKNELQLHANLLDTLLGAVDAISVSLTTFDTALESESTNSLHYVLEILKSAPELAAHRSASQMPAQTSSAGAMLGSLLDALGDSSHTAAEDPPGADQSTDSGLQSIRAIIDSSARASQLLPPASALIEPAREAVRISSTRLDELLRRAEDMLSLKVLSRQQTQDLQRLDQRFNPHSREWTKITAELRTARELIRHAEPSQDNQYVGSILTKALDFLEWHQSQLAALNTQVVSLRKSSLAHHRTASNTVDSFLEETKRLLMTPSSGLLESVPKFVRELSRQLGKEVDTHIKGGDIQLDKRILTVLRDPLMHIIRNCIDHGIETPEQRIEAGKSRRGTLSLVISQRESHSVELAISDNGVGISRDKIAATALRNNLFTKQQLKRMPDEELIGLIFESSFSTTEEISEISGRGLGMAIARDNIQKIGGRIVVETQPGEGTTFRIILPVTIATFRGVIISCGGETLVVPTRELDRVVKIKKQDIETFDFGTMASLDGHMIPIARLDEILALQGSADPPATRHHLALIFRNGNQSLALIIDEILDEQEVLVKQFSKPIVRARHLSGVTILGSGRPAAILNVADLLDSARKMAAQKPEQSDQSSRAPKTVLVVDDTITARMLMRTILESAGYRVKTANDGREALAALKERSYDLVLSDIEMPKMTGLELTKAIKDDADLQKTPVILITSMTDSEYRHKSEEAGANAFFVKSSFDQSNLLDIIKNLI